MEDVQLWLYCALPGFYPNFVKRTFNVQFAVDRLDCRCIADAQQIRNCRYSMFLNNKALYAFLQF